MEKKILEQINQLDFEKASLLERLKNIETEAMRIHQRLNEIKIKKETLTTLVVDEKCELENAETETEVKLQNIATGKYISFEKLSSRSPNLKVAYLCLSNLESEAQVFKLENYKDRYLFSFNRDKSYSLDYAYGRKTYSICAYETHKEPNQQWSLIKDKRMNSFQLETIWNGSSYYLTLEERKGLKKEFHLRCLMEDQIDDKKFSLWKLV
jgi:hypothetical protein